MRLQNQADLDEFFERMSATAYARALSRMGEEEMAAEAIQYAFLNVVKNGDRLPNGETYDDLLLRMVDWECDFMIKRAKANNP